MGVSKDAPLFLQAFFMLQQLLIQNYALIDQLNFEPGKHFTVITGETGAGKSILLGALGLIVGERADIGVLQDKLKKCVVEGRFLLRSHDLKDWFSSNELDYDDLAIIRREITADGRSRAFINDTPVNLSLLKELGSRLIDIHSQHETLTLSQSDFQILVLDTCADQLDLVKQYRVEYRQYKQLLVKLDSMREQEAQLKKDQDYLQFQLDELQNAGLDKIDQKLLEQELQTVSNAEEIKLALVKVIGAMHGGEGDLLHAAGEIRQQVAALAKYRPGIAQAAERLKSCVIELKDIVSELEMIESSIHHDASRIEIIGAMLDKLYHLQHKHQVKTVTDLLKLQDELEEKLKGITSVGDVLSALEKERVQLKKALEMKAAKLSKGRKGAIPIIEKAVNPMLASLGMPHARLEIQSAALEEDKDPGTSGIDKIQFLFSANKGSAAKELQKVASGGELSRLMLAIKSLVAKTSGLPTVIFDEIDTGISGEVADKAGNILLKMGSYMQVVAITHLPQIAAKGSEQWFVFKESSKTTTYTRMKKLAQQDRVEAIAKMLSADKLTEAARRNAQELLS